MILTVGDSKKETFYLQKIRYSNIQFHITACQLKTYWNVILEWPFFDDSFLLLNNISGTVLKGKKIKA